MVSAPRLQQWLRGAFVFNKTLVMHKTNNTKKQRKQEVLQRLTVRHMINNTCIFRKPTDGTKPLDAETVKYIQESLNIYLRSWVIPELEYLLRNIK